MRPHAENRPACMVPLPVTTRILISGGWRTEELLARAVLAAEGVLAAGLARTAGGLGCVPADASRLYADGTAATRGLLLLIKRRAL